MVCHFDYVEWLQLSRTQQQYHRRNLIKINDWYNLAQFMAIKKKEGNKRVNFLIQERQDRIEALELYLASCAAARISNLPKFK